MSLTKLAQIRYANDNQLIYVKLFMLELMYVLYKFCSVDHSVNCLIYKLINVRFLINLSQVCKKQDKERLTSLFIQKGRICLQHQSLVRCKRKPQTDLKRKHCFILTPGAFVSLGKKNGIFWGQNSAQILVKDSTDSVEKNEIKSWMC